MRIFLLKYYMNYKDFKYVLLNIFIKIYSHFKRAFFLGLIFYYTYSAQILKKVIIF